MQGPESGEPLPPLDLPPALVEAEVYQGKVPVPAPVPPSPPDFNSSSIASETTGIGLDEMYSKDEKLLNQFLKLHPMLSNGMLHSQYIHTLVWHCESGCGFYADQYFVPPFLYWQRQQVSALSKLLQACSRRQASSLLIYRWLGKLMTTCIFLPAMKRSERGHASTVPTVLRSISPR